jgi:hypothetical protein
MSHRPLKKTVQVGIEWKKIRSGSHAPSFVARVHESHLACIMVECIVNLVAVCIFFAKSKEPSKLLIGYLIPPSLGHPMELSCVPPFLNL